jgi:DNA-3-methyladenine glycosylase II
MTAKTPSKSKSHPSAHPPETAAIDVDIEAYLKKADPKLGKVIAAVAERVGVRRITPSRTTPFVALARAIIYQRNSDAAASATFKRLKEKAGDNPSPAKVAAMHVETLHAIGLSKPKASYVKSLAQWFVAHPKMVKGLADLSDAEIISHLTEISGIGLWTANVYLIFNLGRLDVIPTADLGIQHAIQVAYGLDLPAPAAMVEELSARWKPYRSIASIYLWQFSKLKLGLEDIG